MIISGGQNWDSATDEVAVCDLATLRGQLFNEATRSGRLAEQHGFEVMEPRVVLGALGLPEVDGARRMVLEVKMAA